MGLVPQLRSSLQRRQDANDDAGSKARTITVAVIIAAIAVLAIVIGGIAYWRKKRTIDRHRRLASTDDSELQQTSETNSTGATTRNNSNAFNNRDNRRSVRSIMTLPPYAETPGETEKVIAREGERDGLDYVLEGPETIEEVEARRQEEVAAIYRVQLTRRRELEERAERRRARRSALERQDYREVARLDRAAREARLRERNTSTTSIGQDSQASGNSGNSGLSAVVEGAEPSSGNLLAELQEIRSRGRRVSSVTYAELGTQRHDGTRLRAASIESDSQPLLDSPALMGRVSGDYRSTRSRASSVNSQNVNANGNPYHDGQAGRERSRSRASRNGIEEDAHAISRQLSEDGIPPEPPSYDDDLSVHAGDAPRYEDVVLDTPRQSVDITINGVRGDAHPHAEVHEEDASSYPQVERTRNGPKPPSAVPLRLQTGNMPTPAIEIVNATPVQSRPNSPLPPASGSQGPSTERR